MSRELSTDFQPKKEKNLRSAPPTEEERAALRAQKEAEKAAKQAAKDAGAGAGVVSAAEVKQADAKAAAVSPVASSSSSVALNEVRLRLFFDILAGKRLER